MVPASEDLRFTADGEALIVRVRQFQNCRLEKRKEDDTECAIDADLGRVGSVWFDTMADDQSKYCVVVGMRMRQDAEEDPQETYYILVVRREPQDERYKRLGVGEVRAPYVSKESDTGKLV
jgi:hypothetical protein